MAIPSRFCTRFGRGRRRGGDFLLRAQGCRHQVAAHHDAVDLDKGREVAGIVRNEGAEFEAERLIGCERLSEIDGLLVDATDREFALEAYEAGKRIACALEDGEIEAL